MRRILDVAAVRNITTSVLDPVRVAMTVLRITLDWILELVTLRESAVASPARGGDYVRYSSV